MQNIVFSFSEGYAPLREACGQLGVIVGKESGFLPGWRLLLLTVRCNGDLIGMASGVFVPEEDTFRIFSVRILNKERLRELAIGALSALLKEARQRFGPRRYEWTYDLATGMRDIYAAFLKLLGLPWLKQVKREILGRRARISLSGFKGSSMLHNRESFSRESLAKSGFVMVPLAEIDAATKEKVERILSSPEEENAGLSPFVGDGDYDEATSFLLLEKSTGDVAGWIVCRQCGRDTEFRRWYTANRFRAQNLGIRMSALLLRIVQETSEGIGIFMLKSSPSYNSLHKLYKGYFSNAIECETDRCRIVMMDTSAVEA